MDVTPTPLGALVDITDPAKDTVIELLADAFAKDEDMFVRAFHRLAEARKARAAAAQAVTRPNEDPIADRRLEDAEIDVDACRQTIVDRLDPEERVSVLLTEIGCRRTGEALLAAAADTTLARQRRATGKFPHQQDWSAA